MNLERAVQLELTFDRLLTTLQDQLQPGEDFTLSLNHERSQFIRFNHARVRQTGSVVDGILKLTLMKDQRNAYYEMPCSGDFLTDQLHLQQALAQLRQDVPQLPVDPYLVLPKGEGHSREVYSGQLLPEEAVASTLLPLVTGVDFTGIYAAGRITRAYADSAGKKHWFATDLFSLDYSLFLTDGQAVKGTLAGRDWNPAAYAMNMQTSKAQLERLAQPSKQVAKGQYRTYLSPAAMADLVALLSWGGVSESAIQQGRSALAAMQRRERCLSPMFSLRENFQRGLVPRFNDWGEIAPPELPVIVTGELANTLVNSRTAKEYNRVANGANESEVLRSAEVDPGNLSQDQILTTLDTGLYISNLHYLNWSDRPKGRITGMTRYACFWVESGEILGPIENLRFDDSLYRFWGENLLALTDVQEFIPDVETYGSRNLGGTWTPGALVQDFNYTL